MIYLASVNLDFIDQKNEKPAKKEGKYTCQVANLQRGGENVLSTEYRREQKEEVLGRFSGKHLW